MRAGTRFPQIPDRWTEPDPGPTGQPGAFRLNAYDFKQVVPPL
jgi:hypothetical protein